MEIIEVLGGIKFFALFVPVAFAYLLLSVAPVVWPAIRAFRKRDHLPRPWLFVFVVAGLVYGIVNLVVFVIGIPVQFYLIFFAPQLETAGIPNGQWLKASAEFVGTWWWVVIPIAGLLATVILTRKLAIKWPSICSVLAT